jgi:long-chain acyl-CoA synthetase
MIDFRTIPSIPKLFLTRAAMVADRPCLWAKGRSGWASHSYRDVAERFVRLAAGLTALGVAKGDRVALIAENRPDWVIADLAIMAAGAISVPAYITNNVAEHRHILANSGATVAIVSTRALADKVIEAARGTTCGTIIAIESPETPPEGLRLVGWADAFAAGEGREEAARAAIDTLVRTDIASIIHTSGTGGAPRGATLTHGNILANCHGAHELLKPYGMEHEIYLSFLPLSHSYEHTIVIAYVTGIGAEIYMTEGAEHLARNLTEVRPTFTAGVPRLYETLHLRITHQLQRESGFKRWLFGRAVAIGRKRLARQSLGLADRVLDPMVDKLVREKIRARFGGRLKAMISGSAPLNPDIGTFFTALGVTILQGYGQTESSPVISVNPPGRLKLDTVGPPVAGVEVKIAPDGEILARGEMVMKGYWNDPEGTAQAVRDGWLHTGDVGEIDADGYLKITDRKKDFIKNSGGDMIAPAKIEGMLTLEPEIAQAMVFGDRRPHLVALVVPRDATIEAYLDKHNVVDGTLADICDKPEFRATVEAAIDRVNARLPQPERVRKFAIAREAFSIANEQMTITLKVRRHKVREAYGAMLEALYAK